MSVRIECIVVGRLETNCYLVFDEDTKEAIITDPGDNAQFIIEYAQKLGVKPVAVFLTHAHADHILAMDEIRDYYDIPMYINDKDVPLFLDGSRNFSKRDFSLREKDVVVYGGEHINVAGFNIEVIHTPGHTPGGTCYYFPEERFMLSGDTLFRRSWGRTDFPGGNAEDMAKSLWEKLLPLPEDTDVYPGHSKMTTIGNERIVHEYVEK